MKLPTNIHPPPAAPILITGLSKILPSYISYPEIKAAHLINITAASLSLITIYIFLSSFVSPILAFSTILLLASNKLYLFYSLDVTNELISLFYSTLFLTFYTKSKKPIIYFLIGTLFLIRYENIVLPLCIFISEFCLSKSTFKIKNIIAACLPIIIWLYILQSHSSGSSLIDNAYIVEIINGFKNIPNTTVFTSLINSVTFNESSNSNFSNLFTFAIIALIFYSATLPKVSIYQQIAYTFLGFSLLFLFLFPNFAIRYYLPFIWLIYLILINHQSRLVSTTVIFCLLIYNFAILPLPFDNIQTFKINEYRLLADWLNSTKFNTTTTILIYEPQILSYFVTNPQVKVPYIEQSTFTNCQQKLDCVAETFHKQNNILVISTSTSQSDINNAPDLFTVTSHHVASFDHNLIAANKQFIYQKSIGDQYHWANIFKYVSK